MLLFFPQCVNNMNSSVIQFGCNNVFTSRIIALHLLWIIKWQDFPSAHYSTLYLNSCLLDGKAKFDFNQCVLSWCKHHITTICFLVQLSVLKGFDLISLLRCCLSYQVTFWMSTAVLAWQHPTSPSAIPAQQICPTSKGNFLVMFYSTASFCVPLASTVCCVMNLLYCVVVIIAVYCQTQMPELS